MNQKIAIIIGAGPAGLTAAYELLDRTDIKPIIYEKENYVGGISTTLEYKGNKIDIGGHRFFSKSERVMDFWQNILPMQGSSAYDDLVLNRKCILSKKAFYKNLKSTEKVAIIPPDPETTDKVMLIRNRVSRVLFLRKFFDYPVTLSANTFKNLGFINMIKMGTGYIISRLFPIKPEKTLEDFFINRFGRQFYTDFFKSYSEKVWGVPCDKINADWGAQRVKGVSISSTLKAAIKNILKHKTSSITDHKEDTSLIKQFLYPKLGAGHIWEETAKIIKESGAEIHLNKEVVGIDAECTNASGRKITRIKVKDTSNGKISVVDADYLFSSMPIKDFVNIFDAEKIPTDVKNTGNGLGYRDMVIVGILLKKLKVKNTTKIKTINNIIPDHWIYMQDSDLQIGRLEIFNNWSPYLVKDKNTVWAGLEYFCYENDAFWNKKDEDIIKFSIEELVKINFIDKEDLIDGMVIRMPKTYPAYFGTYGDFDKIIKFTDNFENLFLIGRNGMHKYNNMDHSMITAMAAVDNIVKGIKTKNNLWAINTEEDYHEEK